ncbi:MAG TPA: hypothetical protein VFT53_02950 [Candidatus Saccharimonadales bacterium]|nr:hypothetical protein [Candidatus Saccharimonadales bacterium]
MITLKTNGKDVIEIDESVITKILDIYPDEHLADRPLFLEARKLEVLTYAELRAECDKLLIPWQLFLLSPTRLKKEIGKIEEKRKSKFDKVMIASRDNEGHGVSLRIADRLIALQDFARQGINEKNNFCGSLKSVHRDKWAEQLLKHFEINPAKLSNGRKEKTLEYLIGKLEEKDIRVSRGVLTNKLLPAANAIRSSYRKSSGFVVQDSKVPYVFLPNEVSDNETPGRQILTLLSLLILIGLNQYNLYITGDLETRIGGNRTLNQIYGVVSEILLPFEATDKLRGVQITEDVRDDLASRYMLTPSAIIVTLRQRGLIEDDTTYQSLLDGIPKGNGSKATKRTPHLDTAVRKLCGNATSNDIINGLRSHTLTSVQAQYMMFGRVDKLKFEKYKANVGL